MGRFVVNGCWSLSGRRRAGLRRVQSYIPHAIPPDFSASARDASRMRVQHIRHPKSLCVPHKPQRRKSLSFVGSDSLSETLRNQGRISTVERKSLTSTTAALSQAVNHPRGLLNHRPHQLQYLTEILHWHGISASDPTNMHVSAVAL